MVRAPEGRTDERVSRTGGSRALAYGGLHPPPSSDRHSNHRSSAASWGAISAESSSPAPRRKQACAT